MMNVNTENVNCSNLNDCDIPEHESEFTRETVKHLAAAAEKYKRKTGLIIISPESYKRLSDDIKADIEKQAKARNCDLLLLPAGTYTVLANTLYYKLSDDGNAQMVLDLCADKPIIYHAKKQMMYIWTPGETINGTTGGHWAEDVDGHMITSIMDDITQRLSTAVDKMAMYIKLSTEGNNKELKDRLSFYFYFEGKSSYKLVSYYLP